MLQHLATLFVLASMVLMVIVSVGLPVWDEIYFLSINLSASTTTQALRFGPWGACFGSTCPPSELGYDLAWLSSATSNAVTLPSIVHRLSYAFVLHPLSAGLIFLSLLLSYPTASPATACLASLLSTLASLATLAAFGVTIAFAQVARQRIEDEVSGASGTFGKGVWLALAAYAAQLVASLVECCWCGGRYDRHEENWYGRKRQAWQGAQSWKYSGWRGRQVEREV